MEKSAQDPQHPTTPNQPQPFPPAGPGTPFVSQEPMAPPQQPTPPPPMEPAQTPSMVPPTSSSKPKFVLILLGIVVVLAAAFAGIYFLNNQKTAQQPIPTPVAIKPTATPTPDPKIGWTTYTDPVHNYSLKYPPTVTLESEKTLGNRANEDYIVLANQIEVRVTTLDPASCTGECPITQDKTEQTTFASLPATRISGSVKPLSGNVAQGIERVVIKNGTKYYIFDLYELERKLTTPAPTNRTPGKIAEEKFTLFNNILSTVEFTTPAAVSPTSPAASTSGSSQ